MTRRAVAVVNAIALALSPGCTRGDGPPAATAVRSRAVATGAAEAAAQVVLPDLSSLAPSVQRQLRERYASLEHQRGEQTTPPAALAAAYGALGRLLMASTFSDEAAACYLHAGALASGDMRWPLLSRPRLSQKGR